MPVRFDLGNEHTRHLYGKIHIYRGRLCEHGDHNGSHQHAGEHHGCSYGCFRLCGFRAHCEYHCCQLQYDDQPQLRNNAD